MKCLARLGANVSKEWLEVQASAKESILSDNQVRHNFENLKHSLNQMPLL
jgi:hypothetical protein